MTGPPYNLQEHFAFVYMLVMHLWISKSTVTSQTTGFTNLPDGRDDLNQDAGLTNLK